MKVVYGIGIGTASIVQKFPITKKLLTIYGEGGPAIIPSHTSALDATVRDEVLFKNLTPEDVQTGFTNWNVLDQKLKRAGNVTNEE